MRKQSSRRTRRRSEEPNMQVGGILETALYVSEDLPSPEP
jgi:hypothetical protein